MSLIPRTITVDEFRGGELPSLSGEQRDRVLIYFNGHLDGCTSGRRGTSGSPAAGSMRCSPRAVYYNLDQSLWSPPGDPARRVALFFRFGVSDGLANPITHHYNAGIGGKGVVRGRPHGTFGVGWSRLEFSKDLAPFLRQALDPGLAREDAVEAYYKVAVTPWLGITLDLQVVESKTWAPPSSAACGPFSGSERVTCQPPAGDHHQQRPTGPRCRTAAVRSRGEAQ